MQILLAGPADRPFLRQQPGITVPPRAHQPHKGTGSGNQGPKEPCGCRGGGRVRVVCHAHSAHNLASPPTHLFFLFTCQLKLLFVHLRT
jgi:hypothetical protein